MTYSAATVVAPEQMTRLMKAATYASVAVALLLIAVKVGAWVVTGSISILSSLVDSLLDAFASLVTLFAVRHAVTPADREHRFGHGKAEPLGGLAQAAFISGSAAFLVIEAVQRLLHPRPITQSGVGIAVMVFSIVATVGLVAFQRFVVRRTGSVAISADQLHYRGDILLNGSVILSLVIAAEFRWPLADPLFALAIAAWLLFNAWRVAMLSLSQLMDREFPDEDRARIRAIATAHPSVLAVHDLRTRFAGPTSFIQLHIEMHGDMTLVQAHEVSEAVEMAIKEAYPTAEIIIHQDPEGVEEQRLSFPPPKAQASG